MKVSVIVPTFDCADRLPRVLASVASQTHRDLEVIVVDEGSRDETDRVVHEIAASFPFLVRYFRRPKRGRAAACNHGARAASGDALAILGADDELHADALARLVDAVDAPDTDFAFGAATRVGPSGREIVEPAAGPAEPLAVALFACPRQRDGLMLVRRAAFDGVGGFDEGLRYAEACELRQRLAVRCSGARVDAALVRVSERGDPASAERAAFLYELLTSAERLLEQEPAFAEELGPRADERLATLRGRLVHHLIVGGDLRAAQRLARRIAPLRDRWQRVALALGSAWPYTLALRARAARQREISPGTTS